MSSYDDRTDYNRERESNESYSLTYDKPKDHSVGFVRTILRAILAFVVLGPVVFNSDISDPLGVFLIILYGVLFYITGIILPDHNDVWKD